MFYVNASHSWQFTGPRTARCLQCGAEAEYYLGPREYEFVTPDPSGPATFPCPVGTRMPQGSYQAFEPEGGRKVSFRALDMEEAIWAASQWLARLYDRPAVAYVVELRGGMPWGTPRVAYRSAE